MIFTLSIILFIIVLTGINTFTGFDMFSNPISNYLLIRSVKRNVKNSGLHPLWEINKIGSKFENTDDGYSIYIEIVNKVTASWTNDIINFKKVNGEWVGNFDHLHRAQQLYDNMWNTSNPDRNLENMIKTEERDKKLTQLGI
jgi:hypothetical protein